MVLEHQTGLSDAGYQTQSKRPLSHLPTEIITEIFLNVCDRPILPRTSPNSSRKTSIVYPLFLGKICKEWRRVAWKCPLLWNVIHIPLSLRKYGQQLILLQEWVARSADCPLSIYLEMHDGEGLWRGTDFLRGLFSLLVEHSDRWENIDIFLPKPSKGVLSAACLRVPLLRSASIRALNSVDVPLEFLESSPSLRSLELKRISPKGVDCQNLTRLVASFVSTADLVYTLQAAPNLQYCELGNTYGTPDSHPILHFSLPFLRVLKLRNCHSSALLPHFGIAPQLEDLEISEWNDHLDLDAMSTFLGRTQSSLQSFTIATGDSLNRDDLRDLLKELDTVTSLEIQYLYVRDDTQVFRPFLKMFDSEESQVSKDEPLCEDTNVTDLTVEHTKSSTFLPSLRELRYQLPLNTEETDLEKLVTVVIKRWNDGIPMREYKRDRSRERFARLETLRFDPSISTSQILDPLRKEMEEGLKIIFDLPFVDSGGEDS
ncbi:hypothetical protein CVT25_009408 [Psilocybe cyanescens]|uniref:Uncharacterized protein n=1 Tax=Psilocybe cyanescens TaxID=93625 RepID=A0A409WW66_PSICY|nr:hypothetical protein CVT25_009408 [Psilocybe cyanescens]